MVSDPLFELDHLLKFLLTFLLQGSSVVPRAKSVMVILGPSPLYKEPNKITRGFPNMSYKDCICLLSCNTF